VARIFPQIGVSNAVAADQITFVATAGTDKTYNLPKVSLNPNLILSYKKIDSDAGIVRLIPDGTVPDTIDGLAEFDLQVRGDTVLLANDGVSAWYSIGSSNGSGGGSSTGDTLAVFIDPVQPSGTINGSNTVFTLPDVPGPSSSLCVERNGVDVYNWIQSGTTLTMGEAPQVGDTFLVRFRTGGTLVSGLSFQDPVTPAGTINGSNTSFTLPGTPSPSASLSVVRNGMEIYDYSLSGTTLTLGQAPSSGDTLLVTYRFASAFSGSVGFQDPAPPSGPIDGTNVTFNLPNLPSPTGSLSVKRNGVEIYGYSLTGVALTLTSPPDPGDNLYTSSRVAAVSGGGGISLPIAETDVTNLSSNLSVRAPMVSTPSRAALTAAVSPTQLYATQSGFYRLSCSLIVTTAGAGDANASFTYSNGSASQTLTGKSVDLGTLGAEASDVFHFYAQAGTDINYAVNFNGSGTYALRVRLEFLG